MLPVRAVPLLLLLDGRLVEAVVPVRPLVPAVGRVLPTCGRVLLVPVPLVRPDALPALTRPVEALLPAVGRLPLIEPVALRPETVAPLCGAKPLVPVARLIDPFVPLLPRRTLAT